MLAMELKLEGGARMCLQSEALTLRLSRSLHSCSLGKAQTLINLRATNWTHQVARQSVVTQDKHGVPHTGCRQRPVDRLTSHGADKIVVGYQEQEQLTENDRAHATANESFPCLLRGYIDQRCFAEEEAKNVGENIVTNYQTNRQKKPE